MTIDILLKHMKDTYLVVFAGKIIVNYRAKS